MPRPQFQDIIPPERRSIQKITLDHRRPQSSPRDSGRPIQKIPTTKARPEPRPGPRPEPRDEFRDSSQGIENTPIAERSSGEKKPGSRKIFIIVGLIIIIVGVGASFIVSMYRSAGAVVTITPQSQQVSVSADLTAGQTQPADDTTDDSIQFQTVSLVRDGTLTVPATSESSTGSKASGTIVIYNAYSAAPQKLVANTRFETPTGLIFRITKPITVPGRTVSAGQTVPGSITATAVADAAGSSYNVGLSDFTLPGLQGTSEYSKIYGRSKTPMQGGASGTTGQIDDSERSDAQEKVESGLQADIVAEAEKEIPAGYILPGNAYIISYQDLPTTSASSTVTISEEADFHGFIFQSSELAAEIAKRADASLNSLDLNFSDTDGLTFKLESPATTTPWNLKTLNFNLEGTTTLVSVIDTSQIQNNLAGKARKNLSLILANYPGIAKVDVAIRPFWDQDFPVDPAKIKVIISTTTPTS